MPDRRSSRLNLAAGVLLLAGLAVAAAVFSHDPADPPQPTVFPEHAAPTNLLGWPGAWLASLLHEALGVTVPLFLVSWFVLVLLLILGRERLTWGLRLLGWLLLLPCASLAADRAGAWLRAGPPAGSGGSLGALLRQWLETTLHPTGQLILFAGSLILALVLALDFLIGKLLYVGWCCARWLVRSLGRRRAQPQGPPPLDMEVSAPVKKKPIDPNLIPIHRADEAEPEPKVTHGPPPVGVADDRFVDYQLPSLELLEEAQPLPIEDQEDLLRERAALLEKTFTDFGLKVKVVAIHTGPVITQYEVALETGLRVNKVTALADDLALNLKLPNVRIVAPIPGKNAVGIEVPNEQRAKVRLKEVMAGCGKAASRYKLPLFLGKDTEGRPLVYDLAEMPHLLIAGRTGTGKSVCMNSLILSLLMTRRPDEVKTIMIDPKMLEMSEYGKIPHQMVPVVKDMKKAEAILSWAVDKMEERYDILSRARVRNVASYNELSYAEIFRRVQPADEEERKRLPERMPYIVIFIDEMADLMMMMKKEVEGHVIRLAQKSRAAGIHLVVATQKPTVDVITGLIKSNLPARICFQVSSRTDSRVVLDEMGGEKLLGKGDMLFLVPGTSTLLRAQGTYMSDDEIHRVVESLEGEPCYAEELVRLGSASKDGGNFLESLRARDPLYEQAIDIVVRERRGSTSLLQRAMGIGYGRAARLIDFMAEDGIVGEYNGSQARDVQFTPEQWDELRKSGRMADSA